VKYSNAQVADLRARVASGECLAVVADDLRIPRRYAQCVVRGRRRPRPAPRYKFSNEQVAEARARVAAGETQVAVAASLGMTTKYVCWLVNGRTR
jgi:hypothetical protein